MSNVKENFLRYVQIETTSSETSGTCPSTPNQWVLAKMLVDELHAMGIENAALTTTAMCTRRFPPRAIIRRKSG